MESRFTIYPLLLVSQNRNDRNDIIKRFCDIKKSGGICDIIKLILCSQNRIYIISQNRISDSFNFIL